MVTVANLPYDFCATPTSSVKQGFMYKNGYDAWFYDSQLATSTQITDVNFPGYHAYAVDLTSSATTATATMQSASITSISSLAGLATATTAAAHGLTSNDVVRIATANGVEKTITSITQSAGTATADCAGHGYAAGVTVFISGASPAEYSGAHNILTSATNTFTYALTNVLVSSPATYLDPEVPATETAPAIPAVPIKVSVGAGNAITALTQANGLAKATVTAHGFTTGNVVAVTGVKRQTYTIASIYTYLSDGGGGVKSGSPRLDITTTAAMTMRIGDRVRISGTGVDLFNADFVVTGLNNQTNTYLYCAIDTFAAGASAVIGTIEVLSQSDYNGSHSITVVDADTFTFDVSALLYTPAAAISGGTMAAVADNSNYNGLQQVTVTGASTFTFPVSNVPATSTTATFSKPHGLAPNNTIVVTGAAVAGYNGTYTVEGVQADFFTYTTAGSGLAASSGTATGGAVTVPGIVSLDTYFIVLTSLGNLFVSDSGNPLRWSGLAYNSAQQDVGNAVALGRSANYAVVLKEWSTEPYYDAGSAVGSPLAPVLSGFTGIGCASGASLATLSGNLFWVSQTKQKGRAVYHMNGLQQEKVSTPDIDRILALSTLATVYSYGVTLSGHPFYVLTLVDRNLTLVYDMKSKLWQEWSSLTPAAAVSISSIVITSGVATVTTATAHGLLDGDPTVIAGASPAVGNANGQQVVTLIDATNFSFETTATGAVAPTEIAASTGYTGTYFKYTKYISALGKDLLQHETNGTLVEITDSATSDVGNPVNMVVRTSILDGGTSQMKFFGAIEVIGDKVAGTAYIRYSGNDYASPVKYRPVPLNAERSRILRCGSDLRRSFELRYLGDTTFRASALDIALELENGTIAD